MHVDGVAGLHAVERARRRCQLGLAEVKESWLERRVTHSKLSGKSMCKSDIANTRMVKVHIYMLTQPMGISFTLVFTIEKLESSGVAKFCRHIR